MRRAALAGAVLCAAAAIFPACRSAADDAAGEKIFYDNCSDCHTIVEQHGGGHRLSLYGLFGRRSGSVDGFDYSPAMHKARVMWNAKTLNRYLADPARLVPGNKMGFTGIADARQRRALIGYLKTATK